MRISDILRHKGHEVRTIGPGASLGDAVSLLGHHNIGALVVTDDENHVMGIISERDVVRSLKDHGADLLGRPVSSVMTTAVVTADSERSVDDIAQIMTDQRIRHVPVVDDDDLVGLISVGDVVLSRIQQLEHDRRQLESYIAG